MRPRPGQPIRRPRANDIARHNELLDQFERQGTPPLPYAPGIMRVQNKSGQRVPKGAILGIKWDERLWDINVSERQFLGMPGVVGVQPRLKTISSPTVDDHMLDWVVTLQQLEEDEIGPCVLSGQAWVRTTVHDENHLFVMPVDDDHTRVQTATGGIARIIYTADEYEETPDPDQGRWSLIELQPATTVFLKGYLTTDLASPAAASTSTTIASDGAIAEDSQTLTSATGFPDTLDEPGISLEITGAGPAGATITTTGTYIDAHTITIDTLADTTVTGATVRRVRTQFSPTTATMRIHERRGLQWYPTPYYVKVENMDHSLSVLAKTFVGVRSEMRDKWSIYWVSCNPAPGSITARGTALESL